MRDLQIHLTSKAEKELSLSCRGPEGGVLGGFNVLAAWLAVFYISIWVIVPSYCWSQDLPNPDKRFEQTSSQHLVLPSRSDTLSVTGRGPFLIRPFIVPGTLSIRIARTSISPDDWLLDARHGFIEFVGIDPDSSFIFVAAYSYVPLELAASYQLWDETDAENTHQSPKRPVQPASRLQTSGSITRGILTGSNRDAAIESGLRLQVEGEVAPGVTVRAALTDEDTPLLPEGTTRRLDQFDRVFIQFESRRGLVQLGDYEARLDGSEFGQLRRKLQGGTIRTAPIGIDAGWIKDLSFEAGTAVSRGIFKSQALDTEQGLQGPYRLTGNDGERFVLVLPGTERVYVDGTLLESGASEDYTIDYSTGELSFTPNRLMGRDKRVRIDFEYTTNRYSRTLSFAEASVGLGARSKQTSTQLTVRAIREADGDAFTDEFGLSPADSAIVADVMDGNAFGSGATEVTYDPEALFTQYFSENTLDTSGDMIATWVVLDRLPSAGEAVYRVTFSWIGEGKGDYKRIAGPSGGIAFQYVGKDAGAYNPLRPLPVPSSRELVDVRLSSKVIPGFVIESEWAVSSLDRNRLSNHPQSLDQGQAGSFGISSQKLELPSDWWMRLDTRYSLRQQDFVTFERARSIEFEREWNLPFRNTDPTTSLLKGESESTKSVGVQIGKGEDIDVHVQTARLSLGDALTASRFSVNSSITASGFPVLSTVAQATETHYAEWISPSRWQSILSRADRSNSEKRWQPYTEWEGERRSGPFRLDGTSGIPFDEYRIGVDRAGERYTWGVLLEERRELSGSTLPSTENDTGSQGSGHSTLEAGSGSSITTFQSSIDIDLGASLRNKMTLGLRSLRDPRSMDVIGASSGVAGSNSIENTLLMSIEGQSRFFGTHVLRWNYRTQSERTAAQQEIYIRTGPERGQYVWVDGNKDGVIQEDEFLPETTPGEGIYVRIFFPTDSLESVTNVQASLRHDVSPDRNSGLLGRFSWRTVLEVSETSRTDARARLYLLDPSVMRLGGKTIAGRYRLSERIGIFPRDRNRDLDISIQRNGSVTELVSGIRTTTRSDLSVRFRQAFGALFSFTMEAARVRDESESAGFSSRTYSIQRNEFIPGGVIAGEYNSISLRLHLTQGRDERSDISAKSFRLPLDWTWSTSQRIQIRSGLEYSNVNLDGVAVGLQLFELTEGRGKGESWLWRTRADVRASETVTATLAYDGRAPSVGPIIHTGRLQLTARF